MSIADLLTRSRQRHTDAQRARRAARIDDALSALTEARDLRLTAHEQDPEHLDQAWSHDRAQKFDHDACLTFYEAELSKDRAHERVIAKSRLAKGLQVIAESLPKGAA